jgi:hypothetical protein
VRVQLSPTSHRTIRDPGTIAAAAAWKAADDGSAGTVISSSSSSSVALIRTVKPSRSNGARARASMRSVWSRLWCGSVTLVCPVASRPAISTHDLTWAVATGS